jgi:formylglycine-generating enzyme required for sulfatase activity
VINVSWKNAKSYVSWLSRKTGQRYRLLSEAEWEYVARAGTTTKYHFGDVIDSTNTNYENELRKPAVVGSYPPNAFGLHDIHGNVWEWVEDCWNDAYSGAPINGSAWMVGQCDQRVLRGGSWDSGSMSVRAASRIWYPIYMSEFSVGFRVARTLSR